MMTFRQHTGFLPFYLCFILLLLVTVNYPFFWDTIQLASKHADFFYNSDFKSIILPKEIDSGHIPSLGIYLALIWKIAGKSLIVSHLAMLPFVLGIVYQSILLVSRHFTNEWQKYALIILLADATLLAQSTLVSPDVLVIFFFLMALNNLLIKNRLWYIVSLLGLTLSSMRGMMCVAGLFLADVIINFVVNHSVTAPYTGKKFIREILRILKLYIPAMALAVSFFLWHYYKTGWIGYHKDMPWYSLFEPVGFKGAIFNTFILGWRLIDFGRLFIWLAGAFCLWHYIKKRPAVPGFLKSVIIVLICIFLSLSHAVILHKNLSGHRYLLPIYLLTATAVTFYLFEVINSGFRKKAVFYLILAGMLSGNFWIYPDRIAKGWDSTLAYLPYFPLREKMMNYMEKESIPISLTGTLFPNAGRLKYIDLSGREDSFAELDLKSNRFVFYSNVYNGFSDNELSELKNNWKQVKVYRFLMVKIILYASPYNPDPGVIDKEDL
jgi:hypothetical protein